MTHFPYLILNRAMIRFTQHTILLIWLNMFKPKLEISQLEIDTKLVVLHKLKSFSISQSHTIINKDRLLSSQNPLSWANQQIIGALVDSQAKGCNLIYKWLVVVNPTVLRMFRHAGEGGKKAVSSSSYM